MYHRLSKSVKYSLLSQLHVHFHDNYAAET